MATPKSWTAHDVEQGKLTLNQFGSDIHVERRYVFVDDVGAELEDVAGGRLLDVVPWADIPANIQDALTSINNWTYNQILIQEQME